MIKFIAQISKKKSCCTNYRVISAIWCKTCFNWHNYEYHMVL